MPATTKGQKAKRNPYANKGYFHLWNEAEKPIEKRRELPIGRDDAPTQVRRFHIPEREIDQLKAAHRDGDKFPNPHNSGNYHFIVEALKSLGLNQYHSWSDFYGEVKRLMSAVKQPDEKGNPVSLWDRFYNRESKSENGRDVDGRLQQNCEVLQRLSGFTPYGYRINQVAQDVLGKPGACIDIAVRQVENAKHTASSPRRFIRLNLNPEMVKIALPGGESVKIPVPINQTKHRRSSEADEPVKQVRVVKAKSAKSEKAEKPRKRVRKAKVEVEQPQTEEVAVVTAEEPEMAGVAG